MVSLSGLEIDEKIKSQFCGRTQNLVTIEQLLVTESLRCILMSAVQKKKNMRLQYLRKKPLKMANDRNNATVPVFNAMFKKSNIAASKLHYK